jgi:hypothetical protein
MVPKAVRTRDAGLALITRVNRWMIAGAVGMTGVIAVAAANANHGRTVSTRGAGAPPTEAAPPSTSPSQFQPSSNSGNSGSNTTSSGSNTGNSGSGLQQPSSAPTPASAPAPAPAQAVSGGS